MLESCKPRLEYFRRKFESKFTVIRSDELGSTPNIYTAPAVAVSGWKEDRWYECDSPDRPSIIWSFRWTREGVRSLVPEHDIF